MDDSVYYGYAKPEEIKKKNTLLILGTVYKNPAAHECA